MGIDLTFIPVEAGDDEWGYGHTLLDCPRDYRIFDRIRELPTTNVPASFWTFKGRDENNEPGYGKTQTDPYGDVIRAVLARDLQRMEWPSLDYHRTRAIKAYIDALEPETKIALYWH